MQQPGKLVNAGGNKYVLDIDGKNVSFYEIAIKEIHQ